MKNLFRITAITAAMLNGAVAAELPTFELMGFPITSDEVAVLGSAHDQEQTPSPTLMLGELPASPHPIAVWTPRPRPQGAADAILLKTGPSFHRRQKTWCGKTAISARCPLYPKSGHVRCNSGCPLYTQKRTCAAHKLMSALGQKRTHAPQQK